jgi:protein-tyrosine phosphatase
VIDLHCHILPGIDDGAADLADSLAMARLAAADGIDHICATPHIRHDHDVRVRELPRRCAALNAALEREMIPVTILPGGEVAETAVDGLDDADLRHVTLGHGGSWVLLEPRPGPLSDTLHDAVASLDDCGLGALIAHPERHLGHDWVEQLTRLVAGGALIQVTADALLSRATADAVLALVHRGLVHVLGSDSHSARAGRPPTVADAAARLREVDPDHADWIAFEAPDAIVRGLPVEPPFAAARG